MKRIHLSIILLLITLPIFSQLYVEGTGGVNTLSLPYGYNFIGTFGTGFNNSKVKIGAELGISTGTIYRRSPITPTTGGISFDEYVDGGNYTSKRNAISRTGNVYENNDKVIRSSQLVFGCNTEWFIIKTFTDRVKWFDIGLFSGIGFGYYHSAYNIKYFQPYVKTGIELNFKVKEVSFLIGGDIRYYSALNGYNNQTDYYHSYIQQGVYLGLRYTIPISGSINRLSNNTKNSTNVNVTNLVLSSNREDGEGMVQDTVIIRESNMSPTTILFANDRYDIRRTEYSKLNSVIQYAKENDRKMRLIGMASSVGTKRHNDELSLKRCETVSDYIVSHGISRERISIIALGDRNSELREEELDRCVIITFE